MSAEKEKPAERSLTARAAWVMTAKSLSFALAFALPLLLVRRLSQGEFGLYKQVFLLVDTAVAVLPLGFYLSAFYYLPREPGRRRQIVFNILLFHLFVGGAACLVLLARPDLAASLLNAPELTALAPLAGATILLWIVSYFLETVAVAEQELGLAVLFIVGSRLTRSGMMFAAAALAPNVRALLYAALAQGALQTIVLLLYLRSRFGAFWRGFEWATLRAQLSYALPLGLAAIILTMFASLDNYFVSHEFGSNAYAVYAVGCFTLPLVPLLGEAVGQVMLPRVSLLQKQGQARQIVELTARMIRKLALVYLPFYALLLVVAREFVVLLFTEQYAASVPVFRVNLTLIPLAVLMSAADPVIRAYAEHRYYFLRLRLALLALMAAAIIVGLKTFGMTGAITAAVAVNCVERLVTARKCARVLGVTGRDWPLVADVWKIAAAAAAAGALTFFARRALAGAHPLVVLSACGAAYAGAYLAAVQLFGVATAAEREAVRGRVTRLLRRRDGVASGRAAERVI